MDKKLEARISRLESMLSCKSAKNEEVTDPTAEAIYEAANKVLKTCQSLAVLLQAAKEMHLPEVENALSLCEDDFPARWVERYNRILSRK